MVTVKYPAKQRGKANEPRITVSTQPLVENTVIERTHIRASEEEQEVPRSDFIWMIILLMCVLHVCFLGAFSRQRSIVRF